MERRAMPIDASKVQWDDNPDPAKVTWDDAPGVVAKGNGQASASPAIPTLEETLGPSDFTKSFASTPFRILKSTMQMLGAGEHVPAVVNELAAEGDKSLPGRIVGDVVGTGGIRAGVGRLAQSLQALNAARGVLPAAARTAEAATYGGAQGALTTPDDQADAAKMGAAGGAAGQMVGRVLGGIVRPTDEARVLMDKGVALTPGQAAGTGSVINKVEQWAASNPIASHFVRGAQRRAVEESNVAAAQTVLNHVNQEVKLGKPPREAIERTHEAISGAYDDALEGMQAPKAQLSDSLKLAFNGNKDHPEIQSVLQDPMIPPAAKKDLANYMTMKLQQAPEVLDGKWLKEMDSELGYRARQLSNSPDPLQRAGAEGWRLVQRHVRNLMEDAAHPSKQGMLQRANMAYRELLALEKSLPAGGEVFTPRRLKATLEKMGIKGSELNRVAEAMGKVLPNNIPDSGTAERLIANALPALLMGGGAGAQGIGLDTIGTGMMAAGALGSRTGAKAMTGSLPMQQAIAQAL